MNNTESESNQTISESFQPDLLRDIKNIENLDYLQAILNSNSQFSAIVNRNKQIILSNGHLLKVAGLESLEQIVGNRPGEALSCINLAEGGVCTSTANCKFCDINHTIHESQMLSQRVSRECRITGGSDGNRVSYDFLVTCAPLTLNDEEYTLLNLVDISSVKRNEMLEKVFFHDILNRLGGLSGIVQILKSENKQTELEEFIDLLETIGEMAIEDIQTQRFLKAAEDANLILNIRDYSSLEIVESIRKQFSFHPVIKSKQIIVCTDCKDFAIKTDGALLKRILLNMATNASEAISDRGSVTFVCQHLPGVAVFSVNNSGIIPEDIRPLIFQRSFSTKGHGRGLGTYSMKLFGENYLNGKVYFTSEENAGTTFTIELPVEN